MDEVYRPLLSTSYQVDDIDLEEIQPMPSSPNLNPDETEVKIVVDETQLKTTISSEEHSAGDTKPLPPGKSTIYLCLTVLRTGMMPTPYVST